MQAHQHTKLDMCQSHTRSVSSLSPLRISACLLVATVSNDVHNTADASQKSVIYALDIRLIGVKHLSGVSELPRGVPFKKDPYKITVPTKEYGNFMTLNVDKSQFTQ